MHNARLRLALRPPTRAPRRACAHATPWKLPRCPRPRPLLPPLFRAVPCNCVTAACGVGVRTRRINGASGAVVHARASSTRYCGGARSPGKYQYSKDCSIQLANPTGGFAGGTWLDLRVKLNPVALGVAQAGYHRRRHPAHPSGVRAEAGGEGDGAGTGALGYCAWELRAIDGMRRTQSAQPGADGVLSYAIRLAPREAHAFELVQPRC